MTLTDVMSELALYGSEQIKQIYLNHGAPEPLFGVKVGDMKKLKRKIGINHRLALELYETGNSDARYLGGLIAEPQKMPKEDLQKWARDANWYMLSEYTIPWVVAESIYALELSFEWIDSDAENLESSGWSTISFLPGLRNAPKPDHNVVLQLLNIVENKIHLAKNRVRYTKNGFVISVAYYYPELASEAAYTAGIIGKVEVNLGKTACKVPLAKEYIQKIVVNEHFAKPRKTFRD